MKGQMRVCCFHVSMVVCQFVTAMFWPSKGALGGFLMFSLLIWSFWLLHIVAPCKDQRGWSHIHQCTSVIGGQISAQGRWRSEIMASMASYHSMATSWRWKELGSAQCPPCSMDNGWPNILDGMGVLSEDTEWSVWWPILGPCARANHSRSCTATWSPLVAQPFATCFEYYVCFGYVNLSPPPEALISLR